MDIRLFLDITLGGILREDLGEYSCVCETINTHLSAPVRGKMMARVLVIEK